MSVIFSFPPEASQPPEPKFLPTVTCTPFCTTGNGHPDAIHPAEQTCRSVTHRIDVKHGGGTGTDIAPTSFASLTVQTEKTPGDQPSITLAIQLGVTETFVVLTRAETGALIDYLSILHDDTR